MAEENANLLSTNANVSSVSVGDNQVVSDNADDIECSQIQYQNGRSSNQSRRFQNTGRNNRDRGNGGSGAGQPLQAQSPPAAAQRNEANSDNSQQNREQNVANVRCYRCKGMGHTFHNCQVLMAHRLFCMRCGEDDVTTARCSN
jgi:hypothetical protein